MTVKLYQKKKGVNPKVKKDNSSSIFICKAPRNSGIKLRMQKQYVMFFSHEKQNILFLFYFAVTVPATSAPDVSYPE